MITQRGVIDFFTYVRPRIFICLNPPWNVPFKLLLLLQFFTIQCLKSRSECFVRVPDKYCCIYYSKQPVNSPFITRDKKHATTDLLRNFSTLSSGQTQQRATQVDTQVHQNLSSVVKLRMKELVRNLSQFWLYQALFPRNMYHVLSRFGKRWWSVQKIS